jgi:hypothetical protein
MREKRMDRGWVMGADVDLDIRITSNVLQHNNITMSDNNYFKIARRQDSECAQHKEIIF